MATSHRAQHRSSGLQTAGAIAQHVSDRVFRLILLTIVVAAGSALFALALLPTVGAAGSALTRFNDEMQALGADIELDFPRTIQRSTIYAADGRTLATLYLDENRKIVKLRNVNDHVRNAVLAIEDSRFYEHPGLDWRGILRALLTNVSSGEVLQGASTLTQQLARNTFPEVGTDRTLARKIAEARVAMRIEEEYSKDWILARYLNEVYFGRSVYGIGTAAEFYFSKSAKDLTLPEAATLAGLIAAPERFSPVVDKEASRERRNVVLARMLELGYISQDQADRAMASPLKLKQRVVTGTKKFPFFVEFVRQEILDLDNHTFDGLGKTKRSRERSLFQGGLKIYTTLQPKLQRAGERIGNNHLPNKSDPENALASVEVKTGEIISLASTEPFKKSQVNLATGQGGSGRQAGSAFKPFTLVTAFEQGIPPSTIYNGASGQTIPECGDYRLVNASGGGGFMDLWAATRGSVNAVFVQLAVDAGLEANVEVAHRMGIKSPLQAICTLPLGTNEITPLEMASAYTTLANDGKHCEPHAIAVIEKRNGDEIKQKNRCKQVVEPEIAALTVNLLEGVVEGGTGTTARLSPWPIFGKTGTTNDNVDTWFVGCTKQICSSSWVGHPEGRIETSITSSGAPALIWKDFMTVAMKGLPAIGFPGVPQISWPKTKVPDVVGMGEEEATQVLGQAGFTARPVEVDSKKPTGTVVGQSPSGGSKVTLGTAVTIEVSTGKSPKTKVPNVVGMTEGAASQALKNAGFGVSVGYQKTDQKNHDGIVGSQSPGGGSKADEGATVHITVYDYQKPKPKPKPSPSPSPSPSPTP